MTVRGEGQEVLPPQLVFCPVIDFDSLLIQTVSHGYVLPRPDLVWPTLLPIFPLAYELLNQHIYSCRVQDEARAQIILNVTFREPKKAVQER